MSVFTLLEALKVHQTKLIFQPHHTQHKMVHSLDRADLKETTFPDIITSKDFKLYLKLQLSFNVTLSVIKSYGSRTLLAIVCQHHLKYFLKKK